MRFVMIDFLRGFSVFCLNILHDILFFADQTALLKAPMPGMAFVLVLGAPIILFGNWKSFFILISGITFTFTGYKRERHVGKASIHTLIQTVLAFVMFFIFISLDVLQNQLYFMSSTTRHNPSGYEAAAFDNMILQKWWQVIHCMSTPTFFGITFLIMPVINYVVTLPFNLIKKLKPQTELLLIALVWLAIAAAFILCTDSIHYGIYELLKKRFPHEEGQQECPWKGMSSSDVRGSAKLFIKYLPMMYLVGGHTHASPLLGNFFLGCALGCFYASIVEHKKKLDQPRWTKWRMRYLWIMGFSFVVPGILLGIQSYITLHNIDINKRRYYQTILGTMNGTIDTNCIMAEQMLQDAVLQFLALFICVLIFEKGTIKKAARDINRTLYMRRFSTGSMTVYVYSLLLGGLVRRLFNYDPTSVPQAFGVLLVQCVIQLLLTIFLDQIDWAGTPDWVLSSVPKLLLGKFRSNKFATKNHLAIKPLLLLGKELP